LLSLGGGGFFDGSMVPETRCEVLEGGLRVFSGARKLEPGGLLRASHLVSGTMDPSKKPPPPNESNRYQRHLTDTRGGQEGDPHRHLQRKSGPRVVNHGGGASAPKAERNLEDVSMEAPVTAVDPNDVRSAR